MTTPTINPKFRALIPPLAPEELAQLESNIAEDGCRDPLVLWNGTIVDGHNRYDICQRLAVKFKTVDMEFADENEAEVWIIRNQFGRRNLTLASRCELAETLALALKPKAKENQKQSKGRGKKGSPILANLFNTREQAAKDAGVSHGSMAAWKFLKENAEPEELEELKRNPNSKLHKAVKVVKERKCKASRQEKRTAAAAGAVLDLRIHVGDFQELAGLVPDGSVNLIFTDPPYDKKSDGLLFGLAEFAEQKLAEGGSLLCYVGQTQILRALNEFERRLRYWWVIACVHGGGKTVMREYGINAGWKAVLWFVKGTRDDNSVMVNDVMSGGQEKSHHEWQQAESEAAYWIEKLCPADGIVCDPFMGSGTTAVAAQKLDRKWVGFEIDRNTAKAASRRIAE